MVFTKLTSPKSTTPASLIHTLVVRKNFVARNAAFCHGTAHALLDDIRLGPADKVVACTDDVADSRSRLSEHTKKNSLAKKQCNTDISQSIELLRCLALRVYSLRLRLARVRLWKPSPRVSRSSWRLTIRAASSSGGIFLRCLFFFNALFFFKGFTQIATQYYYSPMMMVSTKR